MLAAFVALHVDAAGGAGLRALLPGGRLEYPSGYANANAAQWLMAFWPALLLARGRSLPWAMRGVLAGGAVLLAEVALLSQSRGSLYATPVMLVLVFALLPGRMRTFAVLVPVAAGIAAAAPAVLRVGDHLRDEAVVPANVHSATVAMFAAAVAVGLVVALGAAFESRLSERSLMRARTGTRAAALVALVAVLAGALAVAGNPVARIEHGWDTFKGGYAADSTAGSRLVERAGQQPLRLLPRRARRIPAHPLVGIGADNFAAAVPRAWSQQRDAPLSAQRRAAHASADGSGWGAVRACRPRRGAGGGGTRASQRRSARSRGRRQQPSPALPTGSSTARSTGSGSSRGWERPRSRCWASPARSRPRAS